MYSNGCIYHVVKVKNLHSKSPPLGTVPIVKEFLEVFSDDIPRISIEREIDFCIELFLDRTYLNTSILDDFD